MERDHLEAAIDGVWDQILLIQPGMPRRGHNRLINGSFRFLRQPSPQGQAKNHWKFGPSGRTEGDNGSICMQFIPKAIAGLLLGSVLVFASACSPTVDHRGYLAKPGAFNQIQNGMNKSEVESILGSPSTTASINFQGDSYYYISSVTEQKAFLNPKEVSREVIAIRFNKSDQVTSFAQYGLEDGRIIDINTRETPTVGTEYSLLRSFFGGIGKPGGTKVNPLDRGRG
jgi:outer membrane protein assembly factor BamE (lipoprotein component of BamABCDE complex)